MKKTTYLFLIVLGLGFMSACKKDLKEPVLDASKTTPSSITSPQNGDSITLLEVQADSLIKFQWTATQYNLNNLENTNYVLQMDRVDSNFVNATDLAATNDLSFEISVSALNQMLKGKGLLADSAQAMEFRVNSFVNDASGATDVVSEPTSVYFTPYENIGPLEPDTLWVPGDYQGWNPGGAPVIFSYTGDGIFKGYIYFPEGGTYEFKFTSNPDWDHTNYGFAADGELSTDPTAGNLTVPGAGGYEVVVDINALTWTMTAENWGVIGEWLGWTDDINMEWNPASFNLELTLDIPDVPDNRFKFRANDAWDINIGAKDPDDGTLVQDGADIPFPGPGNYTFVLILNGNEPRYELIAN